MDPHTRTITVALDMSKAFDTIHIQTLIPAEYKSNLDLKINNTALPMATHTYVIGLTLDPKLTYNTHIHNISVQAHKTLQMIKAVTAA